MKMSSPSARRCEPGEVGAVAGTRATLSADPGTGTTRIKEVSRPTPDDPPNRGALGNGTTAMDTGEVRQARNAALPGFGEDFTHEIAARLAASGGRRRTPRVCSSS
jgi:hypothetical protein